MITQDEKIKGAYLAIGFIFLFFGILSYVGGMEHQEMREELKRLKQAKICHEPMPHFQDGQVMRAEDFNRIVDEVRLHGKLIENHLREPCGP